MGKILGPLHEESYVHVHDVRDDAYGYGGLTQGQRYIARQFRHRSRRRPELQDPRKADIPALPYQCPLLGVKRTSPELVEMFANDLKRILVTDVNN